MRSSSSRSRHMAKCFSPITGPGERRAHYATGTTSTVSYLAASDTDPSGGGALTGVIALAVPFPPPGRAVAVLFPGIDGMAHAAIDVGTRWSRAG